MTYQARLASVLMACHSMDLRAGDGLGGCPACLDGSSGFWFGGDVDLKRYWESTGSLTRANGVCCRHRAGCDRRTRGDVHRCESRSAPADRRPATLGRGIVGKCGPEAQWGAQLSCRGLYKSKMVFEVGEFDVGKVQAKSIQVRVWFLATGSIDASGGTSCTSFLRSLSPCPLSAPPSRPEALRGPKLHPLHSSQNISSTPWLLDSLCLEIKHKVSLLKGQTQSLRFH